MSAKTKELRGEMLCDLFTTALEGGIGYWSSASAYHWSNDDGTPDLDGFYAEIEDDEADGKEHRDCIVYVVHAFEPTAWDAMAYDVADRIHMRRHPDSSVHLGADIARIVMSHTISDMQSSMVERGAVVADIQWEMQRAWVDYDSLTGPATQGHRVVRQRNQ